MRSPSTSKTLPWVAIVLVPLAVTTLGMSTRTQQTIPLWHEPGKDRLSCSSCHSPSGREVWDSDITSADVLRRSMNHLSEAESAALVQQFETERLDKKVRPGRSRPLQPGGKTLTGKTPVERDEAFGASLSTIAPKLATGEVWTLSQAESAADELCATPLNSIATGIVFDPVSRDPYHSLDGPALGDWIPDTGLSLEATRVFEKACHDHVRPDKTYNLAEIEKAVQLAAGNPKTVLERLSRLKRLALLKYESYLESGDWPGPEPLSPAIPDDPVWAVGNTMRLDQGLTPEIVGIGKSDAVRMGVDPTKPLDLTQNSLSWLWIGWTIDPSLVKTTYDRTGQTGQYLNDALWLAGPYAWHAAYFSARRALEERNLPGSAGCFKPELNGFVNNDVLKRLAPGTPEFRAFCANILRMDCLILERDLSQGRKLHNHDAAKQHLSALWQFVKPGLGKESTAKTQRIVDQTFKTLALPEAAAR